MQTSHNEVSSGMENMKYDDIMKKNHPRKRLERLEKLKKIKQELHNERNLAVNLIVEDDNVMMMKFKQQVKRLFIQEVGWLV